MHLYSSLNLGIEEPILMVYKTHGRGPLINSHFHRHLTPPLHLQPWKYMSAREYNFLSHELCTEAQQDKPKLNKEKKKFIK